MNERIHQYLDGDRNRASLSPEDANEADRVAAAVEAAATGLRSTSAAEDLDPRVMARVRASRPPGRPASRVRRMASRLTRRREVSFAWRPVYGLAAAGLALAMVLGVLIATGGEEELAVAPETPPTVFVQFTLRSPDASRVSLAGSFSGWEPRYALSQTASGVWTVTVPLEPGVHDYAFVVDGRWVADPDAPQIDDGFGGTNNRLPILPPRNS